MRQAEVYSYRPEDTNPCAGIKRYRRQGRDRFLSTAEVRRLGEVLTHHEADHPQAVAIIRLLLLTGCRKGEIVSLKWSFYREGKLFLPDSKSGPRTVWLSSAARAILDGLPRTATWIFPSPQTGSHLNGETVRSVWCRVCGSLASESDRHLRSVRFTPSRNFATWRRPKTPLRHDVHGIPLRSCMQRSQRDLGYLARHSACHDSWPNRGGAAVQFVAEISMQKLAARQSP